MPAFPHAAIASTLSDAWSAEPEPFKLSAIRHDDDLERHDLERRCDLQPSTAMMIKNPQPNATAMTMNRHHRLSFDLPKCVERMKNRRVTDRPKPS